MAGTPDISMGMHGKGMQQPLETAEVREALNGAPVAFGKDATHEWKAHELDTEQSDAVARAGRIPGG